MRFKTLLLISFFLSQFSFGQKNDVWIRFYDSATELAGFKDLNGNIKIPAKYENFTRADSFYNIIAVAEKIDSSYKSYYLLKNGRKVGQDSVFMFDFTYDCESEGKILFRDYKKDRVGFLDKNGVAIIPAIYNIASPFRNGLAIALRNAKRKCWDGSQDTLNCEHLGWSGGETVLINDKNEILADSLTADLNNINWYSLKINTRLLDTSIYITIPGNKGNIYSFVDYEKEFTKWFHSKFLRTLNLSDHRQLKEFLFPEIMFWNDKDGWTSLKKDSYLQSYPTSITKNRFEETPTKILSIRAEDLNYMIFEDKIYKDFYNACGSHNKEKYPVFDVILTYYQQRTKKLNLSAPTEGSSENIQLSDFDKKYEIRYQESFEFIRTKNGYQLLSVSLKH